MNTRSRFFGRRWRSAVVGSVIVTASVIALPPLTATAGAHAVSPYPFKVSPGIFEAYVTGADPGTPVTIYSSNHLLLASGTADSLGSYLARNLSPLVGVTLNAIVHSTPHSAKFNVLSPSISVPSSLYTGQTMHVGLNYLKMRDGVTLAATLRLPPGKSLANGPFPTLIEYSGYDTAGPASLIDSLTGKPVSNPALLPSSSTIVGSFLAPELGFAVVSLQMRGTACSGGAFDLFGYDSDYDGYDAVEIVAHQKFALNHKVGMAGISYSGISQFEVAGTQPPDLAAITPMSPTDDLYSTGYPGGIYNNGFAASWIADRINDSLPASQGGQPWAQAAIATGDTTCANNQALHLQAQSLTSILGPGLQRDPLLFDQRSPAVWATHVKAPVFVVGSLQDEQTGPQWMNLISALKSNPAAFATTDNGLHIDSMGPDTITRWLEFLDLYVAGWTTNSSKVAAQYATLKGLEPLLLGSSTGTSVMPLPALRFTTITSLAKAKAAFVANDPRVRVLYNNGGSALGAGTLEPTGEQSFSSWPPTTGTIQRLYLGSGGTLNASAGSATSTSFNPDPSARPATDLPSGNPWNAQPPYAWEPVTGTNGVGFVTPAFSSQTTIDGPASLDLYLKSTALDTDLEATITEVRPNGQEMFVATGELRASDRYLSSSSTVLHPVPSYLANKQSSLPAGSYSLVRIPLDPIAHVFPAGTRLRVVISAPGGDHASWTFATPSTGGTVVDTISLGGAQSSSLVVEQVANPTVLPVAACGALRGEPCRTYVTAGNGG